MNTCTAESQVREIENKQPVRDDDALRKDIHLGLQMCRANSLSLTRLQLALNNGNRQCVLEAVDSLHELDTRIGRLLNRLPVPDSNDPELQAICRQVDKQSMAVAFEKLALVSAVSGPDMVTASRYCDDHFEANEPEEPEGSLRERWELRWKKVLGVVLALAAFMAVVFVAIFGLVG